MDSQNASLCSARCRAWVGSDAVVLAITRSVALGHMGSHMGHMSPGHQCTVALHVDIQATLILRQIYHFFSVDHNFHVPPSHLCMQTF